MGRTLLLIAIFALVAAATNAFTTAPAFTKRTCGGALKLEDESVDPCFTEARLSEGDSMACCCYLSSSWRALDVDRRSVMML